MWKNHIILRETHNTCYRGLYQAGRMDVRYWLIALLPAWLAVQAAAYRDLVPTVPPACEERAVH